MKGSVITVDHVSENISYICCYVLCVKVDCGTSGMLIFL